MNRQVINYREKWTNYYEIPEKAFSFVRFPVGFAL